MKRRALKETLPNECIELFNYDPTLTIRNVMLHSTSPQLPKGKNIKLRLYIASSHTARTQATLLFQTEKVGKQLLVIQGSRRKHTYVHHKTPATLTTSLGRLLKSLNGDSKVFVSTFNITTSSSDLFFTLCLKNTIINTHLSIVSFQTYHELRHVEKINFNALALEKKENSTL